MNQLMMKSDLSNCFSIVLLKENWKRFWSIPVVAFLIYFVSAGYTLLSKINNERYNFYLVNTMLNNQNVGYLFIECALPVVLAVCLFSYMNKANSVNLVHSLPYTRRQLYISNFVSGVTMFAIPQILNVLMLIALKKPTYNSTYDGIILGEDIFTNTNIMNWFDNAFTISFFVLALCTFACAICGNGVIAVLTGCTLNVIVPVIVLCFEGYAEISYFGFDDGTLFDKILVNFHPAVKLTVEPSMAWLIAYLAIALLIVAAGDVAYAYRKLERCTDSFVYAWAKHIVGFLFVFIIATGFGMILFEGMGIVSYILGGIVGFLIGQMISRKTFKIFNLTGLKNFVIYAVIYAVILVCINIDITGFQKRVPAVSNIESVYMYSSELDDHRIQDYVDAATEDDICRITAFHKDITDNIDALKNNDYYYQYADESTSVSFTYRLKNGTELKRSYWINRDFVRNNKHFIDIKQNSSSFEIKKTIANIDYKNVDMSIVLWGVDILEDIGKVEILDNNYYEYGVPDILLSNDVDTEEKGSYWKVLPKESFFEAFSKDLLNSKSVDIVYGEVASLHYEWEEQGLTKEQAKAIADAYGCDYSETSEVLNNYVFFADICIYDNMTNSVNWLIEHLAKK